MILTRREDINMDKSAAWRKFSKTGAVEDYLQFRNCADSSPAEAKKHENEYRRSGAKGNGHGGK